ncbi:MAG: hypothetical protein JF887_14720 [Candidatus Dormibacteraeota bacterium]|uniref:Peptidase S53 activation domain-containing protein n=1 Tax=Candidatus Amunia macphersoniae TaxID=3127014 RepID=A0A934NG15_9BACT|nr:hypothetical protein [Candidatus Dormibacteraeota bacterium]
MTVELPGSCPGLCAAPAVGPLEDERVHEVVCHLRPRPSSGGLGWVNRQAQLPVAERRVLSWREHGQRYGASPEDAAALRRFAAAAGLEVIEEDLETRRVVLAGQLSRLGRAFEVRLRLHGEHPDTHLTHDGPLRVPPHVRAAIRSVLGLDGCTRLMDVSDGPSRVAAAADASHRAAAALVASGDSPDGGVAVIGAGASADLAAAAVRSVAPAAHVMLHHGGTSPRDLVDGLLAALRPPTSSVIAIASGAPEAGWSGAVLRSVEQVLLSAAALGVTVVCAGPLGEAWFPATSPHVVACGPAAPRGSSGRAISAVFPAPCWQEAVEAAGVSGRAVPDLAVLLPERGDEAQGEVVVAVATVAGRAAGAFVVAGEQLGARVGLVMPLLIERYGPGCQPIATQLDASFRASLVDALGKPGSGAAREDRGALAATASVSRPGGRRGRDAPVV